MSTIEVTRAINEETAIVRTKPWNGYELRRLTRTSCETRVKSYICRYCILVYMPLKASSARKGYKLAE
jgi:hypothetical protein